MFRVTNVKLCTNAVAAKKPSITGILFGTLILPQQSAIPCVTGKIKRVDCVSICFSQHSKVVALCISRRFNCSMPWRISPNVKTEMYKERSLALSNQFFTPILALSPLRHSDNTLVSTKNPMLFPVRNLSHGQNHHRFQHLAFRPINLSNYFVGRF